MGTHLTSFRPSLHGLKFGNSYSSEDIMEEITGLPDWMISDILGSWGLCGGMCFVALDRYFEHEPRPEATTKPGPGVALFSDLVERQLNAIASVGLTKIIDYQIRPDEGSMFEPQHSLGYYTKKNQWPKIRDKIKDGIPTTMCLIREDRSELYKVGDNHMVVAWGYSYNSSTKKLTINVYDPNYKTRDDIVVGITFGLKNSRLDAYQSPGTDPRGFLQVPYDGTEVVRTSESEAIPEQQDDMEWIWTVF